MPNCLLASVKQAGEALVRGESFRNIVSKFYNRSIRVVIALALLRKLEKKSYAAETGR
jgi:hypothetical protein